MTIRICGDEWMDIKKLGEICTIVSGGTPSRTNTEFWDGGTIPWIKIGDIKEKHVSKADEYITQAGLEGSSAKMLSKGTILYTIFATLGEAGILTIDACTNQAIAGITIKNQDEVLADYLYYYLKSKKSYVNNLGRGVAQNNINLSILRNLEVPLPALPTQRQTVDILDKTAKVIEYRQQQLQKLDDLVKARFVELFGDLKSNSKHWQVASFTDCAIIDTKMIHDFCAYENYPHIGIDSIEKGTGRLYGYKTVAEDAVISGKYIFTPAHIIYSKIRPNLNKVALPDFTGLCSADAYPILVKSDVCNREFLGYTMRNSYFLDYILAFSGRTNLPKVNKNQVEGFTLPLPPIELQNQFSAFVTQTDKSKVAIQKALDEAQLLFDSLIQKYFE